MTVAEWLATRTPPAPDALTERLNSAVRDGRAADAAAAPQILLAAAEERLARFLTADDRACRDALELLAIDALVTYAFEAAADGPLDELDRRADAVVARIAAMASSAARGGEGAAAP